MTSKQNLIFFGLVTLLIVSLVTSGNWSILWDGIFNSKPGSTKPPKYPMPGKPPVGGHCPPGYHPVGGICVPIK